MKKLLLGLVGLSAALASCGVTVEIPAITPAPGNSTNLTLTTINSYTTNWQLTQDATDQNNNLLKQGTYVICDDQATTMNVNVAWTGYLKSLYVQFKGLTTSQYTNVSPYTANSNSGNGTASFTFSAGTAPLSVGSELNPQAIIVNGKVDVKGNTYVRLQGVDQSGNASNILESVTAIPVLDCVQ